MTPMEAYEKALAEGPSDETRAIACQDAWYAYLYALLVDKGPRDESRRAACREALCAYTYARYVDKYPHDETRAAACGDAEEAYRYALAIDKCLRPDTYEAASSDPYWKARYEDSFPSNRIRKQIIIRHIRLTYVLGATILLSMFVKDIEYSTHFLVTVTIASILATSYIFWPTKKYKLSRIRRQYPFVVSLSLALLLSIPLQVITLLPNTHPSLPFFLALCYALYKAPSHASEARAFVMKAFPDNFEDTKP